MIGALILALAAAGAAAPAEAATEAPSRLEGPFAVRDEWLLVQPRLVLMPAAPDPLGPGETALSLDLAWGNDFGWHQDAPGENPAIRWFLVDGEHRTLGLTLARGLGGGREIGFRIPLEWRGGGVLDGAIDWFHGFTRRLGLPENERPLFATDRFRVVGLNGGLEPLAWEGRPGTGLGNLELTTKLALRRATTGWRLGIEGRIALPTAFGAFPARGIEGGAQLLAARRLGERAELYLGAGGTVSSERELEGLRYARSRASGFLCLAWRAGTRWSLLLQTDAASRAVTNIAEYPALAWYLRLGARRTLGDRWSLDAGFTENLKNQQATTDFGIFLGVRRTFPRRGPAASGRSGGAGRP